MTTITNPKVKETITADPYKTLQDGICCGRRDDGLSGNPGG